MSAAQLDYPASQFASCVRDIPDTSALENRLPDAHRFGEVALLSALSRLPDPAATRPHRSKLERLKRARFPLEGRAERIRTSLEVLNRPSPFESLPLATVIEIVSDPNLEDDE